MSSPLNPLAYPVPTVPQEGQLVPLGHAVIKVDVSAETTMPDTPNGYTAALKVMADEGDLDTEKLRGQQGPPGDISFQVRDTVSALYTLQVPIGSYDPTQPPPGVALPVLPDNDTYIGTYATVVVYGVYPDGTQMVISQWAYIWYGTDYRPILMGAFGPPGQVPTITPEVQLIDPPTDAQGNQYASYIETFGPRQEPTWMFNLAVMPGPAGQPTPLQLFPDVDFDSSPPVYGDLISFTGAYTEGGLGLWANYGLGQLLPQPWSMPESDFVAYTGVAQQAAIGSFRLPSLPYPWTPVVWGHIGATQNGGAEIMLSGDPLMIGCQVLLGDAAAITPPAWSSGTAYLAGDQVSYSSQNYIATVDVAAGGRTPDVNPAWTVITPPGTLIARGLGNTLSMVNIMPHYSSGPSPHTGITPINRLAVIPANTTDPAQTTIYINLWNDGQLGAYDFKPGNAQIMVLAVPVLEEHPTQGVPPTPIATPVIVVQNTDNDLLGLFASNVTPGNAVIVIAGGWCSTSGEAVICPAPALDTVTPPGTFAIWNNGMPPAWSSARAYSAGDKVSYASKAYIAAAAIAAGASPPGSNASWKTTPVNCLQSPPGTAEPGGYWLAVWVMPDCLGNNGVGFGSFPSGVGLWDFTALEVTGLGAQPVVDTQSSGSGPSSSTAYSSGWSGNTTVEDELIVAAISSGGGVINELPGSPWVNFNDVYGGSGYIEQTTAGESYIWAGQLNSTGSWVAGVAAIRAQSVTAATSRRRRRRRLR
jgi:hypothetical protein